MSNDKLFIECKYFNDGDTIPIDYTGRGKDLSPEFTLHNLPPETQTIAIIMHDIKHHIFGIFNHWVIWNIPAQEIIPGGIPTGEILPDLGNAVQGIGYGRHRYAGPKPPKGKQHIYRFTFFALRQRIELKSSAKKKQLLQAIEPYIIQSANISGRYE